jgi:hypothetical protein
MDTLSLDPDRVVADARAVDGLSDFGDERYREPMEQLLWSLQHEAQLNSVGLPLMRQRVVDILATRLRVQAWLQRHPEIRDEQISEPLVIVGLPRTGTTMLHRTIAADPRMYAPLWYETRYPCPALDWDFTTPDQRISDASAEMQAMLDANPELLAIHPMDAVGPDEEIMLLEQSFYSTNPQAFANVPSYDAWLDRQDHRVGYEYLHLLLQFLQWQKKRGGQAADRWVLKSPHHLHVIDSLFRVFPDARVVQSHRDPVETIPSLASMIAAIMVIYSDAVDPQAVGPQWAQRFARGMRRTMTYREQVGDARFLDLWFRDTVSQPLREIQKIYAFLGMDLTEAARAEMARWQEFNRRELRPPHDYTLQQYGLTEAGLQEQFRDYRQRFLSPGRDQT